MAQYTVQDNESGKKVTFQWDSVKPPADEDMEEIFKEAGLREPTPQKEEKIGQDLPVWAEPAKGALETAGLVGGGALGTMAGVPLGPVAPLAGVAGAGAGYAGGSRAYRELMRILGYGEHPSIGKESLGRTGSEMMGGGETEMLGGIGGKVIPKALQKILAPNAEFISSPEGKEVLNIYRRFGIEPTPAELSPASKTISIMEGVLMYRPFSGDVMLRKSLSKMEALNNVRNQLASKGSSGKTVDQVGKEIRKEASDIISRYQGNKQQQVKTLVDDFISRIGTSSGRYESGAKFSDMMWAQREGMADKVKVLFDDLKTGLPSQGKDPVPLSQDTIDLAKNLLAQERSKAPPLRNQQVISTLESFGAKEPKIPEGVSEEMIRKDPTLRKMVEESNVPEFTWEGLQNTRSELLERIRNINQASKGMPTNESRIYGELQESILNDMGTFAEKTGGDVWKIYGQAREASKSMHDIFDKDILKIMNKNAGDVIQSIIRGGKPVLNQVKAAVGNDGINVLRQGFFKEMLESATEKGVLNPKVLSRRLRTMGNETLDTFLEPNQRKLLDGIIKKSEYIQTKMANKEGRFKTWDFLETIAGTNNDRVTNAIVQPENLGLIKIAKNVLSKDRINEIQSTVIGNKIFSVSGTGNYLPVSSTKNFLRYRSVLKELMDPVSFNELSDFVSLGQHMNRIEALAKNVSQTGQVLLGSQTGSAILSSLAQPLKVAQLTLLPWMLGKIYASPQAAKYFTSAAKLPSWSPYAAKSFIQALTIAGITEEPKVEEKPAKPEPKISDKGAFPSVGP